MVEELKVAMQLSGAKSIAHMRQIDIVVTGETRNWLTLRGFEETLKDMAQRRWRKYKSSEVGNWSPKNPAQVEVSEVHPRSD